MPALVEYVVMSFSIGWCVSGGCRRCCWPTMSRSLYRCFSIAHSRCQWGHLKNQCRTRIQIKEFANEKWETTNVLHEMDFCFLPRDDAVPRDDGKNKVAWITKSSQPRRTDMTVSRALFAASMLAHQSIFVSQPWIRRRTALHTIAISSFLLMFRLNRCAHITLLSQQQNHDTNS